MKPMALSRAGTLLVVTLACACSQAPAPTPAASPPTPAPAATAAPAAPAPSATRPAPTAAPLPALEIQAPAGRAAGIQLDQGGDFDTRAEPAGDPPAPAWSSGNGAALPAADGNTIADAYIQFRVDDALFLDGQPTARVRVEVDYLDLGMDTFSLQYDGLSGPFAGAGTAVKTNSGGLRTAAFNLCDARFGNGSNGADFRLSDNGDGAEHIRAVRVVGLPAAGARPLSVDAAGANPYDDQPDSDAIQAVLDSACSGDTIVFTSGVGQPNYQGYRIDKTLFLTGASAKQDLTFTASDPDDHARLQATADLRGFVVRLYARSRFSNGGDVDRIDFGYIDIDGARAVRSASGADGASDGRGDNWGSWLPNECGQPNDPWCNPGNLGMDGGIGDWTDAGNTPARDPRAWSTGLRVHDLVDRQAEAGTALAFFAAESVLENVTVDTAGDHVHEAGCAFTDDDGDQYGWSDGITAYGPGLTIRGNTVVNPSDVGIVYFGGTGTTIADNTVQVAPGNYGAFAGIAIHPWIGGDISGLQLRGNRVSSQGDARCGGLHAGINIGTHMWGGGVVAVGNATAYGNLAAADDPSVETVQPCVWGQRCQIWAYLPEGGVLDMRDNQVTGAHINYLVDGLAAWGEFVDVNNVSAAPQRSDWHAARAGCNGLTWGPVDKAAHDPSLAGYRKLAVHCER